MKGELTDEEIKDAWAIQQRLDNLRRRIEWEAQKPISTIDDFDEFLKRIAKFEDLIEDICEEAKDMSEDIIRREWEEEFNKEKQKENKQ